MSSILVGETTQLLLLHRRVLWKSRRQVRDTLFQIKQRSISMYQKPK